MTKVKPTRPVKRKYQQLKQEGRLSILEVLESPNPVSTLRGLIYLSRKEGFRLKVMLCGKVFCEF